jgi:hypothetical protein
MSRDGGAACWSNEVITVSCMLVASKQLTELSGEQSPPKQIESQHREEGGRDCRKRKKRLMMVVHTASKELCQ